MKKGTFVLLGIAIAVAIAVDAWIITTTFKNSARLKAVEAHVAAAHGR